MEWTLRKLEARDLAAVTTILSKVGIKEIKTFFQSETGQKLLTSTDEATQVKGGIEVSFEIAGIILANYSKCQSDLFKLLASLSGLDVKDIESLSLADFADLVVITVQQDGFKDFFKVVSRLFQ